MCSVNARPRYLVSGTPQQERPVAAGVRPHVSGLALDPEAFWGACHRALTVGHATVRRVLGRIHTADGAVVTLASRRSPGRSGPTLVGSAVARLPDRRDDVRRALWGPRDEAVRARLRVLSPRVELFESPFQRVIRYTLGLLAPARDHARAGREASGSVPEHAEGGAEEIGQSPRRHDG